jgi:putative PIN family toxin of toxin-antitoxin system
LLRAVLDANVYVSAIIQPAGTPGRLIERFLRDERFEVVISPGIVDEVLRALGDRKVQRLLRGVDAQLWFEDIVVLADVVADTPLSGICARPAQSLTEVIPTGWWLESQVRSPPWRGGGGAGRR